MYMYFYWGVIQSFHNIQFWSKGCKAYLTN